MATLPGVISQVSDFLAHISRQTAGQGQRRNLRIVADIGKPAKECVVLPIKQLGWVVVAGYKTAETGWKPLTVGAALGIGVDVSSHEAFMSFRSDDSTAGGLDLPALVVDNGLVDEMPSFNSALAEQQHRAWAVVFGRGPASAIDSLRD